MNKQAKIELAELLQERAHRNRYNKLQTVFPDSGRFSRANYPAHIRFMSKGHDFPQRAFIAANRTGKTFCGAYEMSLHLTGLYPCWWTGKRFHSPVSCWAASISNGATRDIIQRELMGPTSDVGSGMLPKHLIHRTVRKAGVSDAFETVYVKYVSDGYSDIGLKSYEQGSMTFQGVFKQVVWLDEEPTDGRIYTECYTRTSGGTGNPEDDGIVRSAKSSTVRKYSLKLVIPVPMCPLLK